MPAAHLAIALSLFVSQAAPAAKAEPREALDGVDAVVLLTQGKEIVGKPDFKVTRGPFVYLFVSAESKAAFEKTPAKYEIQLNGACAKMGGARGNPSDFAVVDGKIYVFGSDDCHKKFVKAPDKYLPVPAPPMPASAQDVRRGKELLDRAIQAVGGTARLAAVKTYAESSTQTQKRPQGEATIVSRTTWRFPGDVRDDRTLSLGERVQKNGTLVTAAGGWFLAQSNAFPQSPEARAENAALYSRRLLPLLRAFREPGFAAAAVPAGAIDGAPVDRVRVKHGAADVTLSLEKGTGLVRAASFRARGIDSEFGEFVVTFGDFRDVSGLRLPFSERATFNGAPDDFLTRTITAIEINPAVDEAAFQPGPRGGQ